MPRLHDLSIDEVHTRTSAKHWVAVKELKLKPYYLLYTRIYTYVFIFIPIMET